MTHFFTFTLTLTLLFTFTLTHHSFTSRSCILTHSESFYQGRVIRSTRLCIIRFISILSSYLFPTQKCVFGFSSHSQIYSDSAKIQSPHRLFLSSSSLPLIQSQTAQRRDCLSRSLQRDSSFCPSSWSLVLPNCTPTPTR